MTRHDLISIAITFLVGFFAGGYLYLTGFAAWVADWQVSEQETIGTFRIVGERYGGCALDSVCPSFLVATDGSYRYRYSGGPDAEPIIREGVLPRTVLQKLESTLTHDVLNDQAEPVEVTECPSFVDGVDVRYEITVDGTEYTLNSCGTEVRRDSALWRSLRSLWDYFSAQTVS